MTDEPPEPARIAEIRARATSEEYGPISWSSGSMLEVLEWVRQQEKIIERYRRRFLRMGVTEEEFAYREAQRKDALRELEMLQPEVEGMARWGGFNVNRVRQIREWIWEAAAKGSLTATEQKIRDLIDGPLTPDDFEQAVRDALKQLDGTTESAVALLTGWPKEKIRELGGVPDER